MAKPFEVRHIISELKELAGPIKSLNDETRVTLKNIEDIISKIVRNLSDSLIFVHVVYEISFMPTKTTTSVILAIK